MRPRALTALIFLAASGCLDFFEPASGQYVLFEVHMDDVCSPSSSARAGAPVDAGAPLDSGDEDGMGDGLGLRDLAGLGGPFEGVLIDVMINDSKQRMNIATLECELEGRIFTCPLPFERTQDMAEYGLNALVHFDYELGGEWTTSQSFDLSEHIELTCEGTDCELLASIVPCEMNFAWEAEFFE